MSETTNIYLMGKNNKIYKNITKTLYFMRFKY